MGKLKEFRGGLLRWLADAAASQVAPYLWAALVIAAGALQGLPWAYVLAAAGVGFGGVFWGLNNSAVWGMRLREEKALIFSQIAFNIGPSPDHDRRLGIRAEFELVNHSNLEYAFEVIDHRFWISKVDGTSKAECIPFRNSKRGVIGARSQSKVFLPIVIIDDLKAEGRLRGEVMAEIAFGPKNQPKYKLRREFEVFVSKQENGLFNVESTSK